MSADSDTPDLGSGQVRLSTLARYLCGDREAIISIASSRSAIWLGLLFVLAAGFAREYDGEDLFHEPWHLLIPLVASLVASTILYAILFLVSDRRQEMQKQHATAKTYFMFLGLFWMTAPLAWLYAIPFERFLTAADAVRANLLLLGIIAAWRVALMSRVVSVILGCRLVSALFVVIFFADTVAMGVFWLTPLPVISFMGGIRLSESEMVIQRVGFMVRFLGTATWPIWAIGAAAVGYRKREGEWKWIDVTEMRSVVSVVPWSVAAAALAVWIVVLPKTQPEQMRRRQADEALRGGRVAEAIEFMSHQTRDDFPPHWDPPPRFGYGEREPDIVAVLEQLAHLDQDHWVVQLYREKLALHAQGSPYGMRLIRLNEMSDEQLERYADALQKLPEGEAMARYHRVEVRHLLPSDEDSASISERRRSSLEAIQALIPADDGM